MTQTTHSTGSIPDSFSKMLTLLKNKLAAILDWIGEKTTVAALSLNPELAFQHQPEDETNESHAFERPLLWTIAPGHGGINGVVRYTTLDENERTLTADETVYYANDEESFQNDILGAVMNGVSVNVVSAKNIYEFPRLYECLREGRRDYNERSKAEG
jgi:hypothetical protein